MVIFAFFDFFGGGVVLIGCMFIDCSSIMFIVIHGKSLGGKPLFLKRQAGTNAHLTVTSRKLFPFYTFYAIIKRVRIPTRERCRMEESCTRTNRVLRVLIVNDCARDNKRIQALLRTLFGDRVKCFIATDEHDIRAAVAIRPHVIIVGILAIVTKLGSVKNVHALLRKHGLRSWRHCIVPIHRAELSLVLLELLPRFVHEAMWARLLKGTAPKKPARLKPTRGLLVDLDTTTLHNQTAGTIVG